MHPRKLLLPLLLLVSHVTKSGYSSICSILLRLLLVKRPASPNRPPLSLPLDETDVLDDAFVLASDGVLEEADGAEDEELVEGVCASSRFMAGSFEAPALASPG
jgi:hypothetical protein